MKRRGLDAGVDAYKVLKISLRSRNIIGYHPADDAVLLFYRLAQSVVSWTSHQTGRKASIIAPSQTAANLIRYCRLTFASFHS